MKKYLLIFLSLFALLFNVKSVYAADQTITFTNGEKNETYIDYYDDNNNLMGAILVRIEGEFLTPNDNKIILPKYKEPYQVNLEVTTTDEYKAINYTINGTKYRVTDKDYINLDINSAENLTIDIEFAEKTTEEEKDSNNIYIIVSGIGLIGLVIAGYTLSKKK